MQSNLQLGVVPELQRIGLRSCSVRDQGASCSSFAYDPMTRLLSVPESAVGVVRRFERSKVAASSGPSPLRVFGSEATGAVILSAVAGYVDTASFMALFGLFTAHITGDLVTAGTSLTGQLRFGAGTRLVMIPIFMVSVAATTLFARALNRKGGRALAPMLGLLTLALSLFAVTGATLSPLANGPDAWAVAIIGGAGVVAMAIQNTLMRNVLSSYSPTTLMTGNLTQCTIDLVEMALPDPVNDTQGRRLARGAAGNRLKKFGMPLLGFMCGAFSGAWLTHSVGLASIFVPTLAVGVLALCAWLPTSKASARLVDLLLGRSRRRSSRLTACATQRAEYSNSFPQQDYLRIACRRKILLRPAPARSGTYPQLALGLEDPRGCSERSGEAHDCDPVSIGPASSR